MFFYRQRGNSLLKQANAFRLGWIPHSNFLSHWFFVREWRKPEGIIRAPDFIQQRQRFHENNFAKELVESPDLSVFAAETAKLEPEVEPQKIKVAPNYYPVLGRKALGVPARAIL